MDPGSSRMVPLLAGVVKHRAFKALLVKSVDAVSAALNPDAAGCCKKT